MRYYLWANYIRTNGSLIVSYHSDSRRDPICKQKYKGAQHTEIIEKEDLEHTMPGLRVDRRVEELI